MFGGLARILPLVQSMAPTVACKHMQANKVPNGGSLSICWLAYHTLIVAPCRYSCVHLSYRLAGVFSAGRDQRNSGMAYQQKAL